MKMRPGHQACRQTGNAQGRQEAQIGRNHRQTGYIDGQATRQTGPKQAEHRDVSIDGQVC
jgi:hypothetical protein